MKKDISIIVLWGAIWGIFEATAGNVLHSLALNVGWLIWFPAAYYFMGRVYKQTGKAGSIFFTSVIAAAIKLVDFLLPVRVDMIINPAASILLEGLAVFAAYRILELHKDSLLKHNYLKVLAVSVSWRALYLLYLLPLPQFIVKISPLSGIGPFMKFFILQSLVNGAVIYLCSILAQKMKENRAKDNITTNKSFNSALSRVFECMYLRPIFSFLVLLFAIFIQWMI